MQTLPGTATVPFVDLSVVNAEVRAAATEAWNRSIDRSEFVLGEDVGHFEAELADYYGLGHCVTVGNGTDALEVAFRALGIGAGDEVLVPALTFAASGIAVSRVGATPVFVDVDAETLLVDTDAAEAAIGPRTAAVLAVHLHGQLAPLARLSDIACRHGLALVEDGAQSHGAVQGQQRSAPATRFVCTSFYPTKNLGAWGDGGAALTDDPDLAGRARLVRNYGSAGKYDHSTFGFNSRLDTVQAGVLRAKLPHLDRWNTERGAAAVRYRKLLAEEAEDHSLLLPAQAPGNTSVWHIFAVRVAERDRIAQELQEGGIGVGIHYPTPLHLLPVFSGLGCRPGDCPVSEAAADSVLSLPMFVGITPDQQARVASELASAVRRNPWYGAGS